MRIRQYGPLFQLTFLPNFFPVNCYLIEEEKELTLIDAALPYSRKGILAAAAKIGKPITSIVLTHAHEDHVGALDALSKALPEAKVMISKRDARLMAGDRSLEPDEEHVPIRGGVPKSLRTKPDVLLNDGDRIGSLQAIFAPGHTPGLMAFLDVRNGAMVAGDAFQTRGGLAVSGMIKPLFPFPALATWSKRTALESARKLRDAAPALLAVGHGMILQHPVNAMDQAIKAAEQAWNGGGTDHGIQTRT